MKTTTKLLSIALIALTSFATTKVKAQTESMSGTGGMAFKVGIGAGAGVTTAGSPFSFSTGADVRLQWDLSKYVAVTASGGYTRLFNSDNYPALEDYDFIPAIGGVKMFPVDGMYLSVNIGAGFGIQDGSKTSLIYGAGTGYEWKNGFELGLRYEGYTQDSTSSTYQPKNSQIALRIGYNFKL